MRRLITRRKSACRKAMPRFNVRMSVGHRAWLGRSAKAIRFDEYHVPNVQRDPDRLGPNRVLELWEAYALRRLPIWMGPLPNGVASGPVTRDGLPRILLAGCDARGTRLTRCLASCL